MATIIKYRYVLLCILANIIFLWLSYQQYGRLRITVLHFFVGIIPLILSLYRVTRKEQS